MTSLNIKNALNVGAFLLNCLTYFNVDGPQFRMLEWMNTARQFEEFDTIVTPSRFIFAVLSTAVFFAHGVFTVINLLPKYRNTGLVQDGVSFWYFTATVFQLMAAFSISFEGQFGVFFTCAAFFGMIACLAQILIRQAKVDNQQEPEDYWLLRFPWHLQFGWIVCVFIVCFNHFVAEFDAAPAWQGFFGLVSLISLAAISFKLIQTKGSEPNYVIPTVFSIFTLGVLVGFNEPGVENEFGYWARYFYIAIAALISFGVAGMTARAIYLNEYKRDNGAGYAGSTMEAEQDADKAAIAVV